MIRKTIITAIAATMLSTTTFAEDAVHINTSLLDVSNPAEMSHLYADIVTAAAQVCSSAEPENILERANRGIARRNCRSATVKTALAQFQVPELNAVHASLPKRQRYNATYVRQIMASKAK